MARRPRTRRRDRGPVPIGKAYIQSTFNNTIVTLTDPTGNAVAWGSSGTSGFRGSRKSTAFAAQRAGEDAAKKAADQGMRQVDVYVRGPGAGRRSEEHTSELQSLVNLVCRLLLEKKKNIHHIS